MYAGFKKTNTLEGLDIFLLMVNIDFLVKYKSIVKLVRFTTLSKSQSNRILYRCQFTTA